MKVSDQKRNRKRYLILLAICVAAVVVVLDVLMLLLPDRQLSETENRSLQQFPSLTWSAVTQGRFEQRFDDYIADQFPGRDFWIRLGTTASRLGGNTLSNDIFLARDGYLIQKFAEPSEEEYQELLQGMTRIAGAGSNVTAYALIAPTAVSILKDKLPAFSYDRISGSEDTFMDRFLRDLEAAGMHVTDVREELKAMADQGQQVYYRTDHHWTTDAAYCAYRKWAAAAGLPENTVSYERLTVSDQFRGTLSASSGFRTAQTDEICIYLPKEEETYTVTNVDTGEKYASVYDTSFLQTRDQYGLFLGGNHGLLKIRTTAAGTRNLLVVKDSYANCFIPFLIHDFPNIVIADPRYYLGDVAQLIRDEEITDILFLYNAGTL